MEVKKSSQVVLPAVSIISAELENVKDKLVEEATGQSLTLSVASLKKRKKREVQTLSSNGEVEAEEIAEDCETGYETIDDQCREYFKPPRLLFDLVIGCTITTLSTLSVTFAMVYKIYGVIKEDNSNLITIKT